MICDGADSARVAFSGVLGVALDQAGDDLEDRVLGNYASIVRSWLAGMGHSGFCRNVVSERRCAIEGRARP